MHIRISSEGKAEALTLHTCPRKAKAGSSFSRSSSQSTLVARIPILRSGKALVSGGSAKAETSAKVARTGYTPFPDT